MLKRNFVVVGQHIIRIATRRSPLALRQANYVKQLIETADPLTRCELLPMTTTGDTSSEASLRREGNKGLFLKELETALIEGHADVAVHSMKDVPLRLHSDLVVQSIGLRGAAHDVFVSDMSLNELPPDAKIGTSSGRRRALLLHIFKRRTFLAVRGNVQTRLKMLAEGQVDGLVLAAAGLQRLGLERPRRFALPTDEFVPAPCQGILAAEWHQKRTDIKRRIDCLTDADVQTSTSVERSIAEAIGADCATAFGAYCERVGDRYRVIAAALSATGDQAIYAKSIGADATTVADTVGERLLKEGAVTLLSPAT